MRLNEKLIEKDHEEFERVESGESSHGGSQEALVRDLDYFKKETKLLREQVIINNNNIFIIASQDVQPIPFKLDCIPKFSSPKYQVNSVKLNNI